MPVSPTGQLAIETSGAFGPDPLELFSDIARRIRIVTLEVKSRAYLIQRVSVALQQGNAAAILWTSLADAYTLLKIFYKFIYFYFVIFQG